MRALPLLLIAACSPSAPAPVARPVSPADSLAAQGAAGLAALDPKSLETTTKYLASDELAGRGTGTEGGAKAEQYVADRFKQLGLEPAGEGGTYFQTVPFREGMRVDAESSLVVHRANGSDLKFEDGQVLIRPDVNNAKVAVDARIVFVGYGISRPDLGYDDLAGVDLKGAIAVMMGGSPRTRDGKELDPALHAVLSDTVTRSRQLRDRGALAVMSVYDPVRAERMPFSLFITKMVGGVLAWLDKGQPASLPVLPYAGIDEAGFDRILAGIKDGPKAHALWEKLDRGEHVEPIQLGTASLRIKTELHDVKARNVAALLRGTDPSEVVVYTAHVDHLGIGPAVDGDNIYNGAVDNAIGVAAMLEVARAFKALPKPPRRSILFVAVTGEEKGLLGSDYFVEHPLVPLDHIVANVNIDGVSPNWEVHDIIALGAEHSSLGRQVEEAAKAVHLVVSPDPDPAQVYFIRSDQYSFARHGIPAIFPASGLLDASGGREVYRKLEDAWEEHTYHRPSDQWMPGYRAEWTLPEMRFHFLVGLAIANAPSRPTWNAGDVFGLFAKTPFR